MFLPFEYPSNSVEDTRFILFFITSLALEFIQSERKKYHQIATLLRSLLVQ